MPQREDILHEFCRSVDAMDQETFGVFKSIVLDVMKSDFGTVSSDIKLDGCRSDGAPALDSMWLDDKDRIARNPVPVKGRNGEYSSQRAFVYDVGCPLWVSTKSGAPIAAPKSKSDIFIRPWGSFEGKFSEILHEIPEYQNYSSDGNACTSVIVPLRYGSDRPRIFGVLCLEFERLIECTPFSQVRIETLARAISKAIWLNETTREARRGTAVALKTLRSRISSFPNTCGLELPTIFFAYSSAADPKVKQAISETVERFGEYIRLDDWEKHEQPGKITSHILKSISSASYGICYFSEPAPATRKKSFIDNPNVLIEAGMMNVVFHQDDAASSRWLLVREDHNDERITDEPAFDFRDQRHLLVPRKQRRGNQKRAPDVNMANLVRKLETALSEMIGQSIPDR